MNRAEILAQMDGLLKQAKSIEEKYAGSYEPMPKEEQERLAALLGKVDEYKATLDLFERSEKARNFVGQPGQQEAPAGAVFGGWRQAAPNEGNEEVDGKEWREVEIKVARVDLSSGLVIPDTAKVRYNVPLRVQKKGYAPAFEAYLRKGFDKLGPNDAKTLLEGTDSAGGYLVPEEFQAEIIRKMMGLATIRARARVATTGRDIARWPRVVYNADDNYTSGVRFTWTGEAPASSSAHRVTDPVFGIYSIPVHTAMASMPISMDLVEDAEFDVVGLATDMLAEAFTLGENNAFINGSGVGQPMGILTQVDGDGPASVVSGNASALTADGLIDLAYALAAQYEAGAVFVMNKATEKAIRKLKDTTGNYLWPVTNQFGSLGMPARELLGYPVLRDSFVPDVAANSYPIIFGDLRGYLVLDRVGLSVQRLTDSAYAELNLTALLARKRVGGQCIEPWRIKVQKVSA